MTEAVGYAGSLLVAVSLMMSNIRRLRWINLAGALFFVAYGLLVRAYPVAAVNAFIVGIDAYFLIQMSRQKDYFSLIKAVHLDGALLTGFLDFHKADIAAHFPGFKIDELKEPRCIFLLRNLLPVGLFVYTVETPGIVDVHLDFVIPEYRDHKNADYLFNSQADLFRTQGLKTFRVARAVKPHAAYLRKLGFTPSPDDPDSFLRPV